MKTYPISFYRSFLPFLPVFSMLSGCGPINVISTQNKDFRAPISHISILIQSTSGDVRQARTFGSTLVENIESQIVSGDFRVLQSPLSKFGEPNRSFYSNTNRMRLEVVLSETIERHEPAWWHRHHDCQPTIYVQKYLARLYVEGMTTSVWRASHQEYYNPAMAPFVNKGERAARKIFKKMKRNGLFKKKRFFHKSRR